MRHIVTGLGLMLPAVLLAGNGCLATQGWVDTRVNEQNQRIDGVEVSVRDANATAKGARARADEVDGRLTRLWDKRNVRNFSDAVTVQFGFNRSDLDDAAETALVGLVRELQQNPKLLVELEGYADAKGPRDYNVQLSQRRVETVRRYLVQRGVELPRIVSIGLGPIDDPKMPDASKRRVLVKMMLLAE